MPKDYICYFEAIKSYLKDGDIRGAQGKWNFVYGAYESYIGTYGEDEYSRKLKAEIDIYKEMIDNHRG